MLDGYAYCQIVKDSFGTAVDYIFIDVNPAFETITGLGRVDILGKAFTEVMAGTSIQRIGHCENNLRHLEQRRSS